MGFIKREIEVIFERDPATNGLAEVLFCSPGFHAILAHRIHHILWNAGFKFIARFLSQISRFFTGIEIHPGAKIGSGFFIDHGMGVVIGETAEIGKNVTLYQGVTLGGVSWKKEKRHPTIEDDVVIGAGATILGPVRIGNNSRVGSCSVVIQDVPAHSTVVGVPGRVVSHPENVVGEHYDLSHSELPDIPLTAIEELKRRVEELENKVKN